MVSIDTKLPNSPVKDRHRKGNIMAIKHLLIFGIAVIATGCTTTPEPEPEPIIIDPEPIETCTPISRLEKVVIPAKTETFTAIVMIDNPPYAPIERRETQERVVEEAQIIYVDSENREVLDICEEEAVSEAPESETTEAESPAPTE